MVQYKLCNFTILTKWLTIDVNESSGFFWNDIFQKGKKKENCSIKFILPNTHWSFETFCTGSYHKTTLTHIWFKPGFCYMTFKTFATIFYFLEIFNSEVVTWVAYCIANKTISGVMLS